jgi:Uncharacterized proteins involved in stress response, homologs of TerZ and putative cAMP-binding protein CABP1
MLGADGKIPDRKYTWYFTIIFALSMTLLHHLGNRKTGKNQGDNETIDVDLNKISPSYPGNYFCRHHSRSTGKKSKTFSQIHNAFIRLYNSETDSELACYNLKENFSGETAVEFGRLYKKDGKWRFQAVGQGYNAGLQSFVDKYYVENKQENQQAETNLKISDFEIPELAITELAATQIKNSRISNSCLKNPRISNN